MECGRESCYPGDSVQTLRLLPGTLCKVVGRAFHRRRVWLTAFALLVVGAGLTLAFARVRAHANPAHMPPVVELPTPAPAVAKREKVSANTVVVLVIDGIRWQEVFAGVDPKLARRHGIGGDGRVASQLVPNLHALRTDEGAAVGAPGVGPPLLASGPVYRSLPGYMELLSGRSAEYCSSNRCGSVRYPTLIDQVSEDEPGTAALFASWPHLLHAAALKPERALVSAGRTTGTNLELLYGSPGRSALRDRALRAGPFPSKGDFRADMFTAALALDYLNHERPRLLFVSVGEADVWGHANNYRAYLAALHDADAFVGQLLAASRRLNQAGHRTTLIVTTDHGRDAHAREHGPKIPESARVWAMAAGFGVQRRGDVPLEGSKTLSAIAPSVLCLLGLGRTQAGLPELFAC